eukprot:5852740-Prymnesium_polylepis.1
MNVEPHRPAGNERDRDHLPWVPRAEEAERRVLEPEQQQWRRDHPVRIVHGGIIGVERGEEDNHGSRHVGNERSPQEWQRAQLAHKQLAGEPAGCQRRRVREAAKRCGGACEHFR